MSTAESRRVTPEQYLASERASELKHEYYRGEKFAQYRTLPGLRDYILVSQSAPRVELFSRQTDGSWLMRVCDSADATATIPSLQITLKLSDIYARVEFPDDGADAPASMTTHG